MFENHSPLFEEAAGGAAGGGGDAAAQAAAAAAAKAAAGGSGGGAGAQKQWFDGLITADGKINKEGWDKAPDSIKGHKDFFLKYDTLEGLLGGGANANKLAVAKALTPLPENASDEAKAERRAHLAQILNVPKEPAGYGITKPADLPAENWNQGLADQFAKIAHEECLAPGAVKRILKMQQDMVVQSTAAQKQAETAYYASQDKEFETAMHTQGIEVDKANTLALRGAVTLGIKPSDPMMKDAAFRLAMVRLTNLISEDKLVQGDLSEPGKASYRDQALDIMRNPQNPLNKAWTDPNDPGHEDAKLKVNELYKLQGEASRRKGP
jgi:hypothetical protein